MNVTSGYHHMRVESFSQEKLAFAGPNGLKYTFLVMPFGPVNDPACFIVFIDDMDSTRKALTCSEGITIDAQTNTNVIVDDLSSWAPTYTQVLHHLECQLLTCLCQNLSLSLKKSLFFPPRIEFVGHDIYKDGNRPAHQSITC